MSQSTVVPSETPKLYKIQAKEGAYIPWKDRQSTYDHDLTQEAAEARLVENKKAWRGWGWKFRIVPESYGSEWKKPSETPAVANLNATVTVYTVDVADLFMPEIDKVEWIEAGATVYVQPGYGRKPFYAKVEVVNVETQRALVWHIPGGYFAGEWGLDDLELVEAAGNEKAAPF